MANFLTALLNNNDVLKQPGDRIEARVTKTDRKVLKGNSGDVKFSQTQYPNGTIVQTRTIKSQRIK